MRLLIQIKINQSFLIPLRNPLNFKVKKVTKKRIVIWFLKKINLIPELKSVMGHHLRPELCKCANLKLITLYFKSATVKRNLVMLSVSNLKKNKRLKMNLNNQLIWNSMANNQQKERVTKEELQKISQSKDSLLIP